MWLFSTHVCAHLKAIYPLVRGQAVSVPFRQAPRQVVSRVCVYVCFVHGSGTTLCLLARPARIVRSVDSEPVQNTLPAAYYIALFVHLRARGPPSRSWAQLLCARVSISQSAAIAAPVHHLGNRSSTAAAAATLSGSPFASAGRKWAEWRKLKRRWNTNTFYMCWDHHHPPFPGVGSFCSPCTKEGLHAWPSTGRRRSLEFLGADPKIPTRNSFNNVKAETRDKAPAGGNGFFLIKGVHFSFARFGVPFCARLLVTLASIRCAKSA